MSAKNDAVAYAAVEATCGAEPAMASADSETDQAEDLLDPESIDFTAALIEWGRACDAGAEPIGSIVEEQRKVMVAQVEAQVEARHIVDDALHDAVESQQTELMAGVEDTSRSSSLLNITTSADLTVDRRFTAIVNSVSPEFQSSGSDSGINFSVWKTLSGFKSDAADGSGEQPPPIKYDSSQFVAANGAAP